MAAIRHHEHQTPEHKEVVPYVRENLDEQLADQGHWLIQQGERRLCMSCGQSWGRGTRRNMLRLGSCPGPLQWGHWPTIPGVPRPVPRGHQGHVIHYIHVLKWHRGILWCCKCGAYSHQRVVLLARPCRMKAVNSQMKYSLKCISAGHPLMGRGKPWPLPPESTSPYSQYLSDT